MVFLSARELLYIAFVELATESLLFPCVGEHVRSDRTANHLEADNAGVAERSEALEQRCGRPEFEPRRKISQPTGTRFQKSSFFF